MPQNTGVKNRINYFERLVKEDAKFAVNDEKYGEYLKSLGTLVGLTRGGSRYGIRPKDR